MHRNSQKLNPALNETILAFDPQLSLGGDFTSDIIIPQGLEFVKGQKAIVRYYAPTAHSVTMRLGYLEGKLVQLAKQPDGVWSAEISRNSLDNEGDLYTAVFFEIDGVYALNPMFPIGFSHSHPINIIDFPGKEDFYLLKDVPHGTVARDYYQSKSCGCYKSCLVYTPPGYHAGKGDDLPVLYLQHGFGENETSWTQLGKINHIMDNLIDKGLATPCIIVMNNGMVQIEQANGDRIWNPVQLETMLLDDCIPYIEAQYRVSKDKWHRAMAGLSMGSAQTSIITLNHPELFGYVGLFSGFIGKIGNDYGINEHFAAFDDKPTLFDSYKLFFRCMGDNDRFIDQYNDETDLLKAKGLEPNAWPAHMERMYKGGHDWNVWRQCVRDFLTMIFK